MSNHNQIEFVKDNMTNIDIFVIAKELNDVLSDGFISNIYELTTTEGKSLLIKFRTKSGKKYVIIDPKRRINITNFKYPVPPFPSQFITALRKFMKGRRIERVYQHNLDRILVFELKSNQGDPWKFVIEFFAGGNYILIDDKDITYIAKNYKKMRNRMILAKKPYTFPRMRGEDIWTLEKSTFKDIITRKNSEIVRVIARSFNIGGYLAEEICARANIDKNTNVNELNEDQISNLYNEIEAIINILKNSDFKPRVLLDENHNPVGFDAFKLETHSEYDFEEKNHLNEAIDVFFSKYDSEKLFSGDAKKAERKVSKHEKILAQQLDTIEKSKINREKYLHNGHLIYQFLNEIDYLIQTIMKQKRENDLSWNEISNTLIQGKKQNIPECEIFERIFPKEMKILVNLDGNKFKLDLKKNAIENAQEIYKRAKKAKRKIKGAKVAAENTKQKIQQQKQREKQIKSQKAMLLRKPKPEWYEKYRWFFSSDGFLIIGGRDASSNEAIVKKHMIKNDLFFHTDVRGASVCIIKNEENKSIPGSTIRQTAQFASCYSSAWRKGWGNAEIFYVKPEQVSKSPKSGEYLTKGSFIISGKKNTIPKPQLKIAIGLQLIPIFNRITGSIGYETELKNQNLKDWKDFKQKFNEDGEQVQYYPKVISSPIKAMKQQTTNYVVIKPSKNGLKISSLAKKILNKFEYNANEEAARWIRLTPLDDIIRVLPPGNGLISKK